MRLAAASRALVCIAAVAFAAPLLAQSRTAHTVRFQSAALGGEATFAILLPPDYDTSAKRYPVVYLLHGGTQNHTAFPARSWFIKDASRRDMIVVMPHTPQAYFSARFGHEAPFEQFLARDLPAYVDANYRTIADRRARAVAGISMGGYGATMLGLKQGDVFGTIGAISAAVGGAGRDEQLPALVTALAPERAPYFYVACGRADSLLTANQQLAMRLREHKIAAEYHEVPGGHGWEVWDPQMQAFFDVLARQPAWHPVP